MKERMHKAAVRFVNLMGYEILEEDFEGFIVALDHDDDVVFIAMSYDDIEPTMCRDEFEEMISRYFKTHQDVVDINIRFDTISFLSVISDKAIIRHHVNAEMED